MSANASLRSTTSYLRMSGELKVAIFCHDSLASDCGWVNFSWVVITSYDSNGRL